MTQNQNQNQNPMSERESRSSCHLSWLMKSCFPNISAPNSIITTSSTRLFPPPPPPPPHNHQCAAAVNFSSLPDDIVLECISRVPPSSVPVLPQVCRRWARLVASSSFSYLRRLHGLLHSALFALSASSDSTLFAAALRFHTHSDSSQSLIWKVSAFLPENDAVPTSLFSNHARLCAVGPTIYIIGRTATLRYDTWTGSVTAMSPMLFPRKKFAAAAVSGKIYVAGGGGGATAVEEYNPGSDRWSVVSHAPRRRYGCIGASAGGILCVIGGLSIGGASRDGGAAHLYASSMDLYDVEARRWLRSRAVPGGGCVVAACSVGVEGEVYVLASHAVELSFWRFKLKVKGSSTSRDGGGKRGGDGYGEWCRIRSPPVAVAQVSRVRYSCVGVGNKVVLVQLSSCTSSTSGSSGSRLGLVLVYNTVSGEWNVAPDLPEVITRAVACVSLEC